MLETLTQGWLRTENRNGALKDRQTGLPTAFVEALPPAVQVEAIGAAGPVEPLGLPSGTLVVQHPEPLSRTQKVETVRQVPSSATCYAELILDKVFYRSAATTGGALMTLFVLRRYDAAATPARQFASYSTHPLKVFPAADPAQSEIANRELIEALKADFLTFAAAATAPAKPRH